MGIHRVTTGIMESRMGKNMRRNGNCSLEFKGSWAKGYAIFG